MNWSKIIFDVFSNLFCYWIIQIKTIPFNLSHSLNFPQKKLHSVLNKQLVKVCYCLIGSRYRYISYSTITDKEFRKQRFLTLALLLK